jgi:hypothetical protein
MERIRIFALVALFIALLVGPIRKTMISNVQSFIIGAVAAEFRRPLWKYIKGFLWSLVRRNQHLVRTLGHFFLHDKFPQKLGPFALETVPGIEKLYNTKYAKAGADEWYITSTRLKEVLNIDSGVAIDGVRKSAQQRVPLSEPHQMTFGVGRCQKLGIPSNASSMRFASPAFEESRTGKVIKLGYDGTQDDALAAVHFLDVGGFMFFDENSELLEVMTYVFAADGRQDTISFSTPMELKEEWMKELHRQKRFHKVTIPEFNEAGAKYACWLKPGEKFGEQRETLVPHGGLAYIFHEPEKKPLPWPQSDCFFAVSSLQTFKTNRKD